MAAVARAGGVGGLTGLWWFPQGALDHEALGTVRALGLTHACHPRAALISNTLQTRDETLWARPLPKQTRVYGQFCIETLHESRNWKSNGLSCLFE